ncbi:tRNA lysidine(34) synthetase TilS [Phenylobacterium sp. LjRoot225]|uniref:tRNA lysidine(34) synthetase TilS n=1 Tax=Phenylobacterium sp. LjRoot225 TaxID=3342285 RepID=UPI003ED14057
MRGVSGEGACRRVLDRRLLADSPRPIAVALSGGGDSVALLLAARSWAQAHGRRLIALTVDHQLQSQSRAWTEACARLAKRIGAGFQALAWEGPKPALGLPAAARAARHRLLADAARSLGARVLLIGHTADDVLEARAMRAAGATTPEPREWSPSPAWPEGRGLFLLRPLLGVRRAELRDWLTVHGEAWIEDPANADPRFARARARAGLSHAGEVVFAPDVPLAIAGLCRFDPWGGVAFPRAAFRAAPRAEAQRLLGLACVCAGGGVRPPASAARDRLSERLRGEGEVVATLAGSRIQAHDEAVRIVREAGEARRGGLQPLVLAAGASGVWDGRFEVAAGGEGLEVRPLRGLARRLPEDQQRALARMPAAARPALPAIVAADGGVSCPQLGVSPARMERLVEGRLRAAAGLVEREPL